MLPNTEKPDPAAAVLQKLSSSPAARKDQKSNVPALVTSDPVRSYEDILDAAREKHPDLWAAFQAEEHPDLWVAFQAEERRKAKDPAAKHASLLELSAIGEKALSDQVKAEYGPFSTQHQIAAAEPMEQDSFLIHNGVPYMPLSDAARHAGVHRETLLTWMKNQVTFGGEPIEALYFKPTGNHFISQRSVERMTNRFEKWPSTQPAERVTIGQTEEGTGHLSISEAARIVGIADVTLRKWVREGTAPLEIPLNVVRDKSSGYFYIQQQDVLRLAEHVKAFGVPRGGRPQASPTPQ